MTKQIKSLTYVFYYSSIAHNKVSLFLDEDTKIVLLLHMYSSTLSTMDLAQLAAQAMLRKVLRNVNNYANPADVSGYIVNNTFAALMLNITKISSWYLG